MVRTRLQSGRGCQQHAARAGRAVAAAQIAAGAAVREAAGAARCIVRTAPVQAAAAVMQAATEVVKQQPRQQLPQPPARQGLVAPSSLNSGNSGPKAEFLVILDRNKKPEFGTAGKAYQV